MTVKQMKTYQDSVILGIGAPTVHDNVIDAITFWHGMVRAIRNTVNVPKDDVAFGYKEAFEQGERLRGSSKTRTTGSSKYLYT